MTVSKNCDVNYKEIIDSKFVIKIDRRYFNVKYENNNDIVVVLYTMEHFGRF